MIPIYANRALQQAIREAEKSAAADNQRYMVVMGLNEDEDFVWCAVPASDQCSSDEPVYFTEAVAS